MHAPGRCTIALLACMQALWSQSSPAQAPVKLTSRQESREAWFRRGRQSANLNAAALRYRAYQQKMTARQARAAGVAANVVLSPRNAPPAGWRALGPAPLASDASGIGQQDYGWVSGRATAVAIDRSDAGGNTVYIGGAYGGVWKSSNAATLDPSAVVWTPLVDDQPTLAVGAIAIQPQPPANPDPSRSLILVGTGEANSSTDSYYGLGILRSTDAGAHWALISKDTANRSFAGLAFSRIAFSTANPQLAVAATAGASQGLINGLANPPTANLGLYYSTDSGLSWTYASVQDGATIVAPGSVTNVSYNDVAGTFVAALRSHGFYSSTDGAHWTRLASQPGFGLTTVACPASPASASCPIYRGEIAAVPGRNEMYVWYVDANNYDQGLWKTTNAGASWTQISTTSIAACGDQEGCGTEDAAYNLSLAAVPNGATATDLYAGAVNLYKCSLNILSTACNGPNTFLNLTHALGCSPNLGAPAHVHPAQHAIDSLVVSGHVVLYFANDGGIYRALDGYMGLRSGTCDASNQFDSLNGTLGSMTQLVSFAQDPHDANTLLGGAQGNGSPATAGALVSPGWSNVNYGDGGPVEINPDDSAIWFTSTPGINIQRCSLGIGCHAQDFASNVVVSGATLGNDGGAFYTPFILDPQNSNTMLAGTCRVWRGNSDGSGFVALSNNFDTGSDTFCTGGEANLVRSLAAGGTTSTGGPSPVIYAGTDGFGPLVTTLPAAGRIWVSTNADGGPNAWVDRTGAINPQHFPVSAIAVDPADTRGFRAFAALMGFDGPRIWLTRDAGLTWADFTANLIPAPVNALLIDPATGTIYAGTDVGVFASSTTSASWSEVALAGTTGFLPNVPVTALRIFSSGATKLLRASTYGRGLWQFPLITVGDFQLAVPDPVQTVFLGQTAQFTGVVTEINDYTDSVQLSCAGDGAAPPTCGVSPTSVVPTAGGAPFTISATGGVGDYALHLVGAGADPTSTHNISLTLHVIDFGLTAPDTNLVGVDAGSTSPALTFQVKAQGQFSGTVALKCTGLPAGTSCHFSPSDTLNKVAGNPVPVSLTVSTAPTTPAGTYPITINASTAGAADKTQTFSLVVGMKDFSVSMANTSLTAWVNTTATFTGALTTANNYSDAVRLSCGAGAPPSCVVSPATIVPSAAGTAFTIKASSNAVRTYSFPVIAQGNDALGLSHSASLTLQTNFDFSIVATPSSRSITSGQPATFSLDLTPQGGSFLNSVSLSCSGLPPQASCSFTPAQISAGFGESAATLTVTTVASHALPRRAVPLYALWLFASVVLAGGTKSKLRKRGGLAIFTLALLFCLISCGGGGLEGNSVPPPTPGSTPGAYVVTVNADAGSLHRTTTVTLAIQ